MITFFKSLLLGIFLLSSALGALADDPSRRPITIVVPYPPGGFVDNVARALGRPLSAALQQPVLVVNRPGANGDIGHAAVAHAVPDGHTLLLAAPSLAAQPAIDALLGRRPTYGLGSLVPLAQITSDPAVFLVHPSLNVKTMREYVALAKSRPSGISIASSGSYGATHLPMAMVEMRAGIKLLHVPTPGGAQAITMTLGAHTTGVAAAPSVARAHIEAGRLIALGQSGAQRLASLPEVPTFRESGIDVEFYLWTSLFAPANTPPRELARIQDALRKSVQDESFKASLASSQSNLAYVDGEALRALWRGEVAKLQATVRHIGKVEDAR